jgi:hypothetical protein
VSPTTVSTPDRPASAAACFSVSRKENPDNADEYTWVTAAPKLAAMAGVPESWSSTTM